MATNSVNHSTSIAVIAGNTYFLNVVVGNGNVGSSTFQNINGTLFNPDLTNVLIGLGSDLKGNGLDIVTVVMQVNPASLNLILSYYITDHVVADITAIAPTDKIPFNAIANQTVTFTNTLNFI